MVSSVTLSVIIIMSDRGIVVLWRCWHREVKETSVDCWYQTEWLQICHWSMQCHYDKPILQRTETLTSVQPKLLPRSHRRLPYRLYCVSSAYCCTELRTKVWHSTVPPTGIFRLKTWAVQQQKPWGTPLLCYTALTVYWQKATGQKGKKAVFH